MKPATITVTAALVMLVGLFGCDMPPEPLPLSPEEHLSAHFEWSEPVNLGSPINSSAREIMPAVSKDGLRLYFVSNREGGFGNNDIWVSRRPSPTDQWETPVNLGAVINSASDENNPSLSDDGRILFFDSNRPGGHGRLDIYVSHRGPPDHEGWSPPVNLGPYVNTASGDRGPDYVVVSPGAPAMLYFGRGIGLQQSGLYAVPLTRDGEALRPAEGIAELDAPGAVTDAPSVRADAREMFFWSNRNGGVGSADIWMSTRLSPNHAWSSPENLGARVNTAFAEERPELSNDGRVLFFDSNRPGLGGQDIWMSTRTLSDRATATGTSTPGATRVP